MGVELAVDLVDGASKLLEGLSATVVEMCVGTLLSSLIDSEELKEEEDELDCWLPEDGRDVDESVLMDVTECE